MITAKEAKELYDQSGQEVADYLKHSVFKHWPKIKALLLTWMHRLE